MDRPHEILSAHPIILFDGHCILCNRLTRFIIQRDKKGAFRFASLDSDVGRWLIEKYGVQKTDDTVVLIEGNNPYLRSNAILRMFSRLGGLWSLVSLGFAVPRFVRDLLYNFIARNRYRWFGKYGACPLPTPETEGRMLDSTIHKL
jgi:predicted DCC family thiol-disulfide oxidoreductase YuxK